MLSRSNLTLSFFSHASFVRSLTGEMSARLYPSYRFITNTVETEPSLGLDIQ